MMVELPGIHDPFDFCYVREYAAAAVAAERVRCGEVVRRQAVHFPASICRMIAEAVEED